MEAVVFNKSYRVWVSGPGPRDSEGLRTHNYKAPSQPLTIEALCLSFFWGVISGVTHITSEDLKMKETQNGKQLVKTVSQRALSPRCGAVNWENLK